MHCNSVVQPLVANTCRVLQLSSSIRESALLDSIYGKASRQTILSINSQLIIMY